MVQRMNGLPIIVEHPAGQTLDGKEYAARSVGAIMLPYVAGEDGIMDPAGNQLWGVGRSYDEAVNKVLETEPMSTSPAVVFGPADPGTTMTMDDGKTLLIEGVPELVDHIALVSAAVWGPSGVRFDEAEDNHQ